jgi:hypothetical protein
VAAEGPPPIWFWSAQRTSQVRLADRNVMVRVSVPVSAG